MTVPPRPRPASSGAGFTPGRLSALVREDPAFRVTTIDGLHWICPFTGTLVPCPFGFERPALEWLTRERPWARVAQRPVAEVAALRWEHWLKERLRAPEATWLRQFLPDGRWLNPFSGELVDGVPHDGGRLGRDAVRVLAQRLRDCPQAQGGKPLPREVLEARLRALRPPEAAVVARPGSRPDSGAALPRMPQGYRILERLGQGGMSTVYRALQLALQREVALKVLDERVDAGAAYAERFLREARAAARINHPNVVAVYDVGRHGERLYMALELVTGGDAEALARTHGGVLPERRALALARDCARGLQAIAAAGLVHRDIKPANIFIAADGSAKLGDLGLVRVQNDDGHTTVADCAVGTPAFMSPEQALGERDIDIRSDIYALVATLYALLAGGAPYVNSNAFNTVHQLLPRPPPDVRAINPGLSAATAETIARAMAKDRAARYQSPAELLAALEACLGADAAPAPAAAAVDGLAWSFIRHGEGAGTREVAGEAWCIAGAGAHASRWLERALAATFAAGSADEVLRGVPDDEPLAVARVAADGRIDAALRGEALVAVLPGRGDVLMRLARGGETLAPGDALAVVAGAGCRAALGLLLADGGDGGWPSVLLRVAAPTTTAPAR